VGTEVELRLAPKEGTPAVLSTVADIRAAGEKLAQGTGWLAVDTERASAYRYDDRAFLLQFRRRGAGTFLIDPELGHAAMADLGTHINDLTWIIHAAHSDLPCLAAIGLYPAKVIDTELAGRLLGLEKVNLAALTEQLLGVELAKGHGREDWSTRPLPADWLDYAALDVELLIELAEVLTQALAELDRLEWLEQECDDVLVANRKYAGGLHVGRTWRGLKGIGKLHSPEQLNVARALWTRRDEIAAHKDVSPTHVLGHNVLRSIAEQLPNTHRELNAIKGFPRRRRGATDAWLKVVEKARRQPESSWPEPHTPSRSEMPHFRRWAEHAPQAAALFEDARAAIDAACTELHVRNDTLITTSQIRELVWWMHSYALESTAFRHHNRHADGLPTASTIAAHLRSTGFRPWQARVLADVIGGQVLAPMRYPL
jgi:ribonuclease D